MGVDNTFRIALIGNPNSGKSSLFNALTGLNQKISNYPGVTVDKKTGTITLSTGDTVELIDFPGIYSLYPNSSDEKIVVETVTNPEDANYPDAIIYVAASIELEKHFLLAAQLKELGIPMVLCLTMLDLSEKQGLSYKTAHLEEYLEVPVICVSSLTGMNLDGLKYQMIKLINSKSSKTWKKSYELSSSESQVAEEVSSISHKTNTYQNLLIGHHHNWLSHISVADRINLSAKIGESGFNSTKNQITETLSRFNSFTPIIQKSEVRPKGEKTSLTEKIDNIITHRVIGPLIFFALMFFIFQAIYAWSEAPMTWIEDLFTFLASQIRIALPAGWFTDLLADGIIAGLGGVMVFIPQITILFLLITALEEVGYMSRAVFMFDNVMQKFGLNGRSIVALISSGACAIPAIMSTRTIANWKERLTTIMVSPLISCSARIPVYTVLIGFVVPSTTVWGIFNAQGLAFMGLYVLSIVAALLSAWVFKMVLKSDEKSFLMIELPQYKKPLWQNVFLTVKEKVSTFIIEAGKVILLMSIVLWFLASYGPSKAMNLAEENAAEYIAAQNLNEQIGEDYLASQKLEASYAGHIGKFIEPVIRPLGYDWKMGIALITSFAAREVFVGTMATIYSVGSAEDEMSVRERMAAEINPVTGAKRYDFATSLSLLLFYVFALQCMSTLAVTKRETKSWKWPIIQFVFMGVMAYMSSLIAYQVFS